MTGLIFRIERFAIHDGPGIRTTVFLKGCPLRCAWCHSPESQSTRPEFMPPPDRCIVCGTCVAACPHGAIVRQAESRPRNAADALGATRVASTWQADRPNESDIRTLTDRCQLCGTCVEACPTGARWIAGETVTVTSLMERVERDRLFYDQSRGGVTISGGEPLQQAAFVEAVVDECREREIDVAVDTSGFGEPATVERIRPNLFLFDVKAVDEERHRAITGVSNRVILTNLARLAHRHSQGEFRIVVRFPMIPGMNDDDETVREIGRTVSSVGIERIDVLPYHRAGIAKYERLGREYTLTAVEPPSAERVNEVVETLKSFGLDARV